MNRRLFFFAAPFFAMLILAACTPSGVSGDAPSGVSAETSAEGSATAPAEASAKAEPSPYVWSKTGGVWRIIPNPEAPPGTTDTAGRWTLILEYRAGQAAEAGSGELTWKGEGVHEVFDFYPKILPGERTARLAFQSERWGALPQEITIEAGEGFEALGAALRFREADPRRPLEADPGTMMYWPPARWRNSSHELFSHNLYPEIIYLVTESFAVQSRFLKRLAFFTEKPGFAGRIAGDEEIAGQRDWFAHDYRASSLAAFFELARTENFPLNESEILLREILLAHGVIRETGGRLIEGKGALVGLSVESRNRLPVYYVHETVHGLEFTMPELRKLFMEFFDSLSAAEQRFMREALLYREYNVEADRRLLASETAAYLLQQKPGETDRYFREYIRPWYRAYRRVPGTGAGADAAGETLAALDGEGGIFGRRASALQRRFEEITGLRAETFYDLLPKDRSL